MFEIMEFEFSNLRKSKYSHVLCVIACKILPNEESMKLYKLKDVKLKVLTGKEAAE